MMKSEALVPTRVFQSAQEFARTQLAAAFQSTLGVVDHYTWRFVPKDSVLVEYDDKPPLLADQNLVEIGAFNDGGDSRS